MARRVAKGMAGAALRGQAGGRQGGRERTRRGRRSGRGTIGRGRNRHHGRRGQDARRRSRERVLESEDGATGWARLGLDTGRKGWSIMMTFVSDSEWLAELQY